MPHTATYSSADLEKIRSSDTCTVSNAIERFRLRLRNEGFVNGKVQCRFPDLPNVIGFAATARIRTLMPPMIGGCYYDRTDWWDYILTIPEPRIIVMQDIDRTPGAGAFLGEIHANIYRALGCAAFLTNGAVRDLAGLEKIGFQAFSASVSVSHAYAHIVDFGEPVEIEGLKVKPGDILHGDRHGIQSIPSEVIAALPDVIAEIAAEERDLIALCASGTFTMEKLANKIKEISCRQEL